MRGGSLPDSPRYRCAGDGRGFHCTQTAQRDLIDTAVLDEVERILERVVHDPTRQRSLRERWNAVAQPERDLARVRQLEADIARARARRAHAGDQLLDGTMTKADYTVGIARAEELEHIALSELSKLRVDKQTLPPLDEVLQRAGGWLAILRSGDVSDRREVIAALIEHVTPIRERRGVYRVHPEWTPLGKELAEAQPIAA
jgi:hypothetical protein